MNGKKHIFISLAFIAALVIAGVFAWRAHMSLVAARRAQEQEAAMRSEIEKETAAARKDAPTLAARLRAAQHAASEVNPLVDDTGTFWQRVTALAAEIKARKASQSETNKVAFPKSPTTADGEIVFSELLDDSEYAALAKEVWMGKARHLRLDYLRVADLTAEQRDKLEKILSDTYASISNIQTAAAAMGLDAPNDEIIKQMTKEIWVKEDAACREIVGEENSARLAKAEYAGDGTSFDFINGLTVSADAVALRLSYSEEPMSAEQTRELRNLIYADVDEVTKNASENVSDGVASQNDIRRQVAMSDKFNEQAAKILTPVQMAGLAELQEEKRLRWQDLDKYLQKRTDEKKAK